jgi:adenylate cyclase
MADARPNADGTFHPDPLRPRSRQTLEPLAAAEAAAARLSAQGPDADAREALRAALHELRALLTPDEPHPPETVGERARLEIERKYLLTALPAHLAGLAPSVLEQGYLPGERLVERVRRVQSSDGVERFYRTVKDGTGVARLEIEEECDAALFGALWPLTVGRRVAKERYAVPDGGLVWEIDRFTDRDLVLCEVELPDTAVQPALPEWLAPYVVREVTGEPDFVNSNLAR